MELAIQERFPREFRRRLSQRLDQDLLVCVLTTAIIMVVMVLYLLRHLPPEMPAPSLKFQKNYASRILNRETPVTMESSGLAMVPALDRREQPAEGGAAATASGGTARRGGGSGASGRAGSSASGAAGRGGRAGGYYGGASMSAMEGEVSGVGILGVLTAGSGYVSGDYVAGLEGAASAESQRLEEALAGLDGAKVGQYAGRRAGDGGVGGAGERSVLGGRRQSRALSVDDLLGSLQPAAEVKFKDIDRNAQFQRISDNIQQKPTAPKTAEEKARLIRTAQDVQAVVNGHRLAIIDCYKRLLRTQPQVKGKLSVRFAIDPDGRVLWAEITETTIPDQEMQECILQRIRQWNDFGYGDPTVPEQIFRQSYTFGY